MPESAKTQAASVATSPEAVKAIRAIYESVWRICDGTRVLAKTVDEDRTNNLVTQTVWIETMREAHSIALNALNELSENLPVNNEEGCDSFGDAYRDFRERYNPSRDPIA